MYVYSVHSTNHHSLQILAVLFGAVSVTDSQDALNGAGGEVLKYLEFEFPKASEVKLSPNCLSHHRVSYCF